MKVAKIVKDIWLILLLKSKYVPLSLMKRYLAQTLSQEEARKMHPNDFIKQLDIRLLSVDNFMDIHFL